MGIVRVGDRKDADFILLTPFNLFACFLLKCGIVGRQVGRDIFQGSIS
jgi:hypothetical protein